VDYLSRPHAEIGTRNHWAVKGRNAYTNVLGGGGKWITTHIEVREGEVGNRQRNTCGPRMTLELFKIQING